MLTVLSTGHVHRQRTDLPPLEQLRERRRLTVPLRPADPPRVLRGPAPPVTEVRQILLGRLTPRHPARRQELQKYSDIRRVIPLRFPLQAAEFLGPHEIQQPRVDQSVRSHVHRITWPQADPGHCLRQVPYPQDTFIWQRRPLLGIRHPHYLPRTQPTPLLALEHAQSSGKAPRRGAASTTYRFPQRATWPRFSCGPTA